MPDYPPEALAAVSLAIHRAACPLRDDPDHDCARDAANEELFIPRARAALDAAAPVLAEAWGVAAAKTVPCPSCGAPAGEPCRTLASGMTFGRYHADRKRAASVQTTTTPPSR